MKQWTNRAGRIGMALVACAALAAAQMPHFVHARVEQRAWTGSLGGNVQSLITAAQGPEWIGYAVPAIPGHRECDGGWGRYDLESGGGRFESDNGGAAGPVALEGSRSLAVLVRAERGQAGQVRGFAGDCELDAGGLPVIWLANAPADPSAALLSGFVLAGGARGSHMAEGALAALAMQAGGAADQALTGFVAPSQPEWLRGKAAFWLGATRGAAGYEALNRLVRDDASAEIRKKAVFGLFVNSDPRAVDAIIAAAKFDASAGVRSQALFWLAQKAGRKAAPAIAGAIADDPEIQVKKRAVFALTQMPKDEGIPLLIQVAKDNRIPAVRKQAMFWLGQSNDPRAVAFFAELLGR